MAVPNRHILRLYPLRTARRSSWALIATMTVLNDINSAPSAGDSTNPAEANIPAASGSATTLYPIPFSSS